MSEKSGVSCDACRQRKCRCDRKLPSCTQCSTTLRSECSYSEINKRGIPQGYLNSLEQRLAETELALFHTLSELVSHGRTLTSIDEERFQRLKTPSARSKNEYADEWKRYPLNELSAWYIFKRPVLGDEPVVEDHDMLHDDASMVPTQDHDTDYQPLNHFDGEQLALARNTWAPVPSLPIAQTMPEMPLHFHDPASVSAPSEGTTTSGKSRAEAYAEQNKKLYF